MDNRCSLRLTLRLDRALLVSHELVYSLTWRNSFDGQMLALVAPRCARGRHCLRCILTKQDHRFVVRHPWQHPAARWCSSLSQHHAFRLGSVYRLFVPRQEQCCPLLVGDEVPSPLFPPTPVSVSLLRPPSPLTVFVFYPMLEICHRV